MENQTTTNLGIEQLKAFSHQEEYADDYIFMSDHIGNIFQGEKCVKLDAFLFIYCAEGEATASINNTPQHIEAGDMLIVLPNIIMEHVMTSLDCRVSITCYSSRFIQRLTQTEKSLWHIMERLRTQPVKHLGEDERRRTQLYHDLIEGKMHERIDQYQKDILQHLSSAMFCEMIASAHGDTETDDTAEQVRQPDFIFKRFMQRLTADNGRHRTVEYYAQQLCYTSKYLSMIVKQVSGRNALALINENAIEHIIAELRHSDKDIKQIAFEFDFSNNSFFTRFFKKHTGMTPTEFRNSAESGERVDADARSPNNSGSKV